MVDRTEILNEIEETLGLVPSFMKEVPTGALEGFWGNFRDFYFAETEIPNKYKDLIGLAVSGATRCSYCTLFHMEGARMHGATDEEIAEASYMGSFTMLGSTFLNAQRTDYDTFRDETLQIVENAKAQTATA